MTNTELKALRTELHDKETELGNRDRNREELASGTSPDALDQIQLATARDHAMSNLERNSSRLCEVRSALERISASVFGICVGCGENINPRRLAAIPWASFCIGCQEAADRERKAPQGQVEESFAIPA